MSILCADAYSHHIDLITKTNDEAHRFANAVETGGVATVVNMLGLADIERERNRQIYLLNDKRKVALSNAEHEKKKLELSCRLHTLFFSFLICCIIWVLTRPLLEDLAGSVFVSLAGGVLFFLWFTCKGLAQIANRHLVALQNAEWEAIRQFVWQISDERKCSFPLCLFEQGVSAWPSFRSFCERLNRKREKDRWIEIERAIPPIPEPPSPPRFIDAVIVMRQKNKRRYAKWLMDFEQWVSLQGKHSHGRSEQGKIWSWQDRKWHRLFDEWRAKTLTPELVRINHWLREKSDVRREALRREYQRRYSRLPDESEITVQPRPTVEAEKIPVCYGYGHRIIGHDRLKLFIASVVPPMPKLSTVDTETLRCIASYAKGLEGIGDMMRLIHFIEIFQYYCTDKNIPEYGFASLHESGLREIFAAGEIFCCHQQGLLNDNIALACEHMAVIATTVLERDIWKYVKTLCTQVPVKTICVRKPQGETSFELQAE